MIQKKHLTQHQYPAIFFLLISPAVLRFYSMNNDILENVGEDEGDEQLPQIH